MDILPDGSLDYDEVCLQLDYVIAAIHQSFNQSEEEIMKRLENACRNPCSTHCTSNRTYYWSTRDGYKPNIEKLMHLAEKKIQIMEINANPKRLDLNALKQ